MLITQCITLFFRKSGIFFLWINQDPIHKTLSTPCEHPQFFVHFAKLDFSNSVSLDSSFFAHLTIFSIVR